MPVRMVLPWQNFGATDLQKALGVRDGLQRAKQCVKVRKC